MERWYLRVVAVAICIGTYWSASGLLQLHEVFSVTAASSQAQASPASRATQHDSVNFRPTRQYDRLVVVLIDALRADMVLGSSALYGEGKASETAANELNQYMNYTRNLLGSGVAAGFVAHASVPTVTMPRLKALLSGKPPAFIDILKNFNSAALGEENVVQLMRESGSRVVFYGDDTWLKLFPDTFQRSEGTSGFYTRDTVEVDTNVTRHLRDELDPEMQHPKSQDWDVLVLHYLGLDHVGHLRGPRSSLMKNKLHEMDDVVRLVYESVKRQDAARRQSVASVDKENEVEPTTLIVLCSDHGMSEIGNHGGATVEESSALMAFMRGDGKPFGIQESSVLPAPRRLQVDLVPTLATLFGLRIPMYSTGLLLEQVVAPSYFTERSGSRTDFMKALMANLQQLRTLAGIKFPPLHKETSALDVLEQRVHTRLSTNAAVTQGDEALIQQLVVACRQLQDKVALSDGSEYDEVRILGGVVLLLTSGVTSAVLVVRRMQQARYRGGSCSALVVAAAAIMTTVSLSSSSSVENEHATVFFLVTTLLVAMTIDATKKKAHTSSTATIAFSVACLVCVRILRERSQVINFARLNEIAVDSSLEGNAFANDDSVSIWSTGSLISPEKFPLQGVFAVIYSAIAWKHLRGWSPIKPSSRAWLTAALVVFTLGLGSNVWCAELIDSDATRASIDFAARLVYGASVALLCLAIACRGPQRSEIVEMALWLLTSLVQKPSNLPSLAVLCVLLQLLSVLLRTRALRSSPDPFVGITSIWIASAAFFALGNSHLVTTIDISQSYHGLDGYSQEIVGLLTFVNVLSGPLLVFANCSQWLRDTAPVEKSSPLLSTAPWVVLGYQAIRMTFYTIVVYFMRFHLFIWSVFAPKMLYEVVFTVVIAIFGMIV